MLYYKQGSKCYCHLCWCQIGLIPLQMKELHMGKGIAGIRKMPSGFITKVKFSKNILNSVWFWDFPFLFWAKPQEAAKCSSRAQAECAEPWWQQRQCWLITCSLMRNQARRGPAHILEDSIGPTTGQWQRRGSNIKAYEINASSSNEWRSNRVPGSCWHAQERRLLEIFTARDLAAITLNVVSCWQLKMSSLGRRRNPLDLQ